MVADPDSSDSSVIDPNVTGQSNSIPTTFFSALLKNFSLQIYIYIYIYIYEKYIVFIGLA